MRLTRVVAGPTPSSQRGRQIVGGVDVAAQPGPRAGQLDGARICVSPCRIGAEAGIERTPNANSAAVPRAVPVADEAALGGRARRRWPRPARVVAARADRLAARRCSMRLRRWPPRRRAGRCSAGRGDRPGWGRPARVRRVPGRRAAATSSGVTTVIERTAGTADAALMVSTSIASTTFSRRRAPRRPGASRVLAAPSRLTAMISPTSVGAPAGAAHGCHPASRRR